MSRAPNVHDRLRPLRRLAGPIEALQVRRFGRSILSTMFRTPVLLLESTGRRSGERRGTTLAYHRAGDGALLVVGGAGGQTRIPDWVHNLRADGHVTVVVDRDRRPMCATELTGADRRTVWPDLCQAFPRIEAYERRAGRPIPVFRLTDADGG